MQRKVFDKNVSAASGELVDVVPNIAGLVCDWLNFKIKLTFATTGVATTIVLGAWKRAALFELWYRDQSSDQAQLATRNESFESMAQRATLYLDGGLQYADTQFPDTFNCSAVATDQTVELFLRVPFAPAWLQNRDDFAPNLQDLGLIKLTFPSTAPTATADTVTIKAIEVLGYAVCRARRTRTVVARRLFSRQPSQLPVLADRFDIGATGGGPARLFSAHINTSNTSTSAITLNTFPQLSIDGTVIVDGTRLPNMAYIGGIEGDQAYPNSTSQRTYLTSATQFAYLVPPQSGSKASELPLGQKLELQVLGSTVTSGTQYVNTDVVLPLSDDQAAQAVGVPRGAVNVERANSTHKDPTSRSAPFIPAVVVSANEALQR